MKIKLFIFLIAAALATNSCDYRLYKPDSLQHEDLSKLKYQPQQITIDQKIDAWYFSPPKKSDTMVIVFHGNSRNITWNYSLMYWMLDYGYDMLIFDYPGYGKSPGKPNPKNILEAGNLAIKYAKKTWPDKKFIIVGESLGGAIAMRSVIDMPEKNKKNICAVVIEGSFLSYQKAAGETLAKSFLTWPFQWISSFLISDKYAPLADVKKISPIPLMIIHRESDSVIPYELGQEIYEKAGEPKSFMSLEGAGHVNAFRSDDKEINKKKLLEFLKVCK